MDEKLVNPEELEKALDNALGTLEKSKAVSKKDDGQAAAAAKDQGDNKETGEEEEETDDEGKEGVNKSVKEPDFESLAKSIPEVIGENKEASEVVDAMPFVKALVDSVEDQLVEMTKAILYLSDKIETIEAGSKSDRDITVAQAKLVKSISTSIREIGGKVSPRKAFLGSKITILKKSEDGKEEPVELTKSQAAQGLTELHKSGKIGLTEVIKYEGYINNGRQLPDSVNELLVSANKN